MVTRPPALSRLFGAAEIAFRAAAGTGSPAERAGLSVFDRLRAEAVAAKPCTSPALPVLAHLPLALDLAQSLSRAPVAAALAGIADSLAWGRRASAQPGDLGFWDGHANAMIAGPGGLEPREDLWFGVTLMAPDTLYPVHTHPPEEVYLSLTPGTWWNAGMDWTDPGQRGLIYNPPGIRHAMRSGAAPFLALWFLPL